MPNPQAPTTGTTMVRISSEDPCGNYTSGEREVTVVQNLIAGRYISIVEDGNTAEISADPSEGYYNKNEINEILADLDTVQFRIVTALPAIGAGNVIYLVRQEAPLTGYLQYIWNTDDRAYHAIGDTDIDLADYYTKIQADEKFQEKLTYSDPLLRVTDSTEISQINLTTKKVKQMTAFNIWEYLKTKLVPEPQTAVSDNTQFSEVNGNNADVVKNTSGLAIWNYIKSKIGNDTLTEVTDSTKLGSVDTSQNNIVQETTALAVWNYIKAKLTKDTITTVTDTTKLGSIDSTKTNVVQETTAKALFDYMWKKIYPVGAIYISADSTSPATLFGGTWTKIQDRFLLAAGSTYSAGSTGGSAETTIQRSDLPNVEITTSPSGSHRHNTQGYYGMTNGSGNKAMARYNVSSDPEESNNPIRSAGTHTHNFDLNGNVTQTKLNNLPPYMVVNVWRRTA